MPDVACREGGNPMLSSAQSQREKSGYSTIGIFDERPMERVSLILAASAHFFGCAISINRNWIPLLDRGFLWVMK